MTAAPVQQVQKKAGILTQCATAISGGHLVLITDPHANEVPFELAAKIIKKAAGKSCKLFLEAPYNFNGDFVTALETWEKKKTGKLYQTTLAKFAKKSGWTPVGVDCTTTDGANFGLSIDNTTGQYGWERQEHIAKYVRKEFKSTHGGCLLVIGTNHIYGGSVRSKVLPMSKILTGNNFDKMKDTTKKQGSRFQIVQRGSVN